MRTRLQRIGSRRRIDLRSAADEPNRKYPSSTLDLTIRLVSALGVLALGIAGFWFQYSTASAARRKEAADGAARISLPLFRGLTDLQLALHDLRRPNQSYLFQESEYLEAIAGPTFVGSADPEAPLELPPPSEIDDSSPRLAVVQAPVRGTALLVAALLRAQASQPPTKSGDYKFDISCYDGACEASVSSAIDHTSTVFNVDPQAEKAWQRWARGQATCA